MQARHVYSEIMLIPDASQAHTIQTANRKLFSNPELDLKSLLKISSHPILYRDCI